MVFADRDDRFLFFRRFLCDWLAVINYQFFANDNFCPWLDVIAVKIVPFFQVGNSNAILACDNA